MRKLADLIFAGLNGYAVALDRASGEIVWSNKQMRSGYVTLMLDGDRLIVSTNGYLYCLDPLTGEIIWQNPLKGFRNGVVALASVRGQANANVQAIALAQERAANSAAAGAAAST
jgi:outer membrane protein assembly factor BamB